MVDLASAYRVTAKGKTYWYAWRGKGAPRLNSAPGSDAFIRELAAAIERRRGGDPDKVAALCGAFRASDDWKGFAPKTRRDWAPWLDRIQEHFGQLRIAQFGRPEIRQDIKAWHRKFKATPRAADMGLQVLSRLMSFAVSEGKIGSNPVVGIPHLYQNDRSDLIWTAEDFAELAKHASPEVMMAARLASLTALRKSDLLRLSWSHVGPLAIQIRTGKSLERKTAVIPIYDELRAFLDSIPRRATTVLTTTAGRPWASGFGASWNAAVKRAGITLHFHDLRGTAATKLYLGGQTIREIAETMTWSEDRVEQMINRYVKRDELLIDRIRRMDEARTAREKPAAKPAVGEAT